MVNKKVAANVDQVKINNNLSTQEIVKHVVSATLLFLDWDPWSNRRIRDFLPV